MVNPVTLEISRTTPGGGWRTGIGKYLPFESEARFGVAIQPNGPMLSSSNAPVYTQPYFEGSVGNNNQSFDIQWSQPLKGNVRATVRCDYQD